MERLLECSQQLKTKHNVKLLVLVKLSYYVLQLSRRIVASLSRRFHWQNIYLEHIETSVFPQSNYTENRVLLHVPSTHVPACHGCDFSYILNLYQWFIGIFDYFFVQNSHVHSFIERSEIASHIFCFHVQNFSFARIIHSLARKLLVDISHFILQA